MEHSVLEQALQALEASDRRIVQLLTFRRQLALQLAQASGAQGTLASREARVAAVISRLASGNLGPLDTQRLTSIFATVIQLTEPHSSELSSTNGAAKKG